MNRVYKRRMDELREEIGFEMTLMGRLMKSRLKWGGHLVWMKEEIMAKRVDRLKDQGWRKRSRPWLRWKDCARRDITKVGVVEEWRGLAEDRGSGAVLWARHGRSFVLLDLIPYKGKKKKTKNNSDKSPYLFNPSLLNPWFLRKIIKGAGMTFGLVITIWN